jgi:hypothetical protein
MKERATGDRGWLVGQSGLLALALALRLALVLAGGQDYWADEMRYNVSREAAYSIADGRMGDGLAYLFSGADHLGFKIVGVVPAMAERWWGWPTWTAAAFFSLFSVASLWLVGRLARAAGGSEREAFFAVLFGAAACSLFYYTRHFLPYDVALCFCLAALHASLRFPGASGSVAAGVLSGVGFACYNGYWIAGALILPAHVLAGGSIRRAASRALLAGGGLLAPLALLVIVGRLVGSDLIESYREFSRSINQGDFGQGYVLVWEYLIEAEGNLLIACILLSAAGLLLTRGMPSFRRGLVWLGGAAALFLVLVLLSDVTRTFVIYGRIARLVVPCLCLSAAWGLEATLKAGRKSAAAGAIVAGIGVTAGLLHQQAPLLQVFPTDFNRLATNLIQEAQPGGMPFLRILNADPLRSVRPSVVSTPHQVLLQRSHPLQFRPYLYEGYNSEQRAVLTETDISMRLVSLPLRVSEGTAATGMPSGGIRVTLVFPRGAAGASEPLLTAGQPGAANFLYVRYLGGDQIQFGFDAWGHAAALGEPVQVDLDVPHEIVLFTGAQMPQETAEGLPAGAADRLKQLVMVNLDGHPAFSFQTPMNLPGSDQFFLGMNLAGGSTTGTDFSGELIEVERLGIRELANLLTEWVPGVTNRTFGRPPSPSPEWEGYPGPFRLGIRVPEQVPGGAEPIVVSGVNGGADFVFIQYLEDNRIVLGIDHWGAGGPLSAPISLPEDRVLDLIISMGSLLPPPTSSALALEPGLESLRFRTIVVVDGRVVLDHAVASHPSLPDNIQVGINQAGGTTTGERFSGEITLLAPVDSTRMAQLLGQAAEPSRTRDAGMP